MGLDALQSLLTSLRNKVKNVFHYGLIRKSFELCWKDIIRTKDRSYKIVSMIDACELWAFIHPKPRDPHAQITKKILDVLRQSEDDILFIPPITMYGIKGFEGKFGSAEKIQGSLRRLVFL